jgi:triacylglycerol lipase
MLKQLKKLVLLSLFLCSSSNAITTKYPILLAHGLLGFKKVLGAVDYWNGIPATLRDHGLVVHVTQVSKLDATQVRGEQLAEQIRDFLKRSGAEKVNIIGHSHGGLDARYVAGTYPEMVASVTSVGTPHQGALLADKLVGTNHIISIGATTWLNAFGKILALLSRDSNKADARASLSSFTKENTKLFNERFPLGLPREDCGEGPEIEGGIRFYSWAGTKIRTSLTDPTDLLFTATSFADQRETDGLVERCSSHLGKVIQDNLPQNHLDLVNGLSGKVGTEGPRPVDMYVEHARRLQNADL